MNTTPTELHTWFMANRPGDTMLWKGGAKHSIMLMRDTLVQPFYKTYDANKANPPQVVSIHRSKSVSLPVVQFKLGGLAITMRDNFYDWGFAVQSDRPLFFSATSDSIFSRAEVSSCCEGFPDELMLPAYSKSDLKSFGASCGNEYQAWTFIWLVRQAYDAVTKDNP
jgi:hypothetical protein